MNQLDPKTRALLLTGLRSGVPVREMARTTGLSKNTVKRYRKLLGYVPVCECGRAANHQGWCSSRFRRSSGRKEFLATWRRRKARNSQAGLDLMALLSAKVDPSVRGEVLSEMYMRIATGKYDLSDTTKILADAKRFAAKMARGGWREQVSIDRKVTEGGATLLDFLASDSPSPEDEICECEDDAG